jgi:hypothetical protein
MFWEIEKAKTSLRDGRIYYEFRPSCVGRFFSLLSNAQKAFTTASVGAI